MPATNSSARPEPHRRLEVAVRQPGVEGNVNLHMDESGIRIETVHGSTFLHWQEFDQVGDEVAGYRRAKMTINPPLPIEEIWKQALAPRNAHDTAGVLLQDQEARTA